MGKVYHTKKGQPYVIMASGKARFIKKGRRARRSYGVGRVTRTQTASRRRRKVTTMARRRRSYHRSGSRGILGGLRRGITLPNVGHGVVAGASVGHGIGGYLTAYATGGMGGLLGCFISPTVQAYGNAGFNVSTASLHG